MVLEMLINGQVVKDFNKKRRLVVSYTQTTPKNRCIFFVFDLILFKDTKMGPY